MRFPNIKLNGIKIKFSHKVQRFSRLIFDAYDEIIIEVISFFFANFCIALPLLNLSIQMCILSTTSSVCIFFPTQLCLLN